MLSGREEHVNIFYTAKFECNFCNNNKRLYSAAARNDFGVRGDGKYLFY